MGSNLRAFSGFYDIVSGPSQDLVSLNQRFIPVSRVTPGP